MPLLTVQLRVSSAPVQFDSRMSFMVSIILAPANTDGADQIVNNHTEQSTLLW